MKKVTMKHSVLIAVIALVFASCGNNGSEGNGGSISDTTLNAGSGSADTSNSGSMGSGSANGNSTTPGTDTSANSGSSVRPNAADSMQGSVGRDTIGNGKNMKSNKRSGTSGLSRTGSDTGTNQK